MLDAHTVPHLSFHVKAAARFFGESAAAFSGLRREFPKGEMALEDRPGQTPILLDKNQNSPFDLV